ncbi:MAG TPA: ATP-binding domain-containing protein, partial [Armatimonadota bacterium]|nr:ATP-binding domain-containing protein [Armatimonadota bacterium]
LLDAVPPRAKLILLGDAQHLPSVEAGTVLADLAPADREPQYSANMVTSVEAVLPSAPAVTSTPDATAVLADRVVRLVQSHRSGPSIMAVASVVNTFCDYKEEELFSRLTAENSTCIWEDATGESTAHWWTRLITWADSHYHEPTYHTATRHYRVPDALTVRCDETLSAILHQLAQAKILTAIHEGRYGCDGINAYLADTVRHQLDPGSYGRYFAGAPLMIIRNDYTLDLFNGDTGIVLYDTAGGYRVAFPRGEDALLVPLDSLPEHTFAFAITVHKSQGSEYEHVLFALPTGEFPIARRLLTREIIYTGLTRAKQTVTIHSTRDALLQACRSRVQRDSGLSLW